MIWMSGQLEKSHLFRWDWLRTDLDGSISTLGNGHELHGLEAIIFTARNEPREHELKDGITCTTCPHRLYCSASEMFIVNRVPNCTAVIRNLTFRFMWRLGLSSNALVCSIIDSDRKFVSRIRLHWMNML